MNHVLNQILVFLVTAFLLAGSASALEFKLEPSKAIQEVNGIVRVKIYAENAVSLISMGAKVSFNPGVLQVETALKNTDFDQGWIMDEDGMSGTANDRYTLPDVEIDNAGGSVVMIGGRITGTTTLGLNGKVLLGWIDFKAVAPGTSSLKVDLGRYHAQHPDKVYENFVNLDGSLDEPTNTGMDLGKICVAENICQADLNNDGKTDMLDWQVFGRDWGRADCNDPLSERCECDVNGDGVCDMLDWQIFGKDWSRTDCPVCN